MYVFTHKHTRIHTDLHEVSCTSFSVSFKHLNDMVIIKKFLILIDAPFAESISECGGV